VSTVAVHRHKYATGKAPKMFIVRVTIVTASKTMASPATGPVKGIRSPYRSSTEPARKNANNMANVRNSSDISVTAKITTIPVTTPNPAAVSQRLERNVPLKAAKPMRM
jgi:hypothetical protein